MIVLKYSRVGRAAYISHIDTLRMVLRSLARGSVGIRYSEGYNPHPLINLSQPLPLGVESVAEYAVIDNTDGDAESVKAAFNEFSPVGVEAVSAIRVSKNPNIAGVVRYAKYLIRGDFRAVIQELGAIFDAPDMVIDYIKKGVRIREDVKPLIRSCEFIDKGLEIVIASGNVNLRPDRLVEHINAAKIAPHIAVGNIRRICQYTEKDGLLTDMDDYIESFKA